MMILNYMLLLLLLLAAAAVLAWLMRATNGAQNWHLQFGKILICQTDGPKPAHMRTHSTPLHSTVCLTHALTALR